MTGTCRDTTITTNPEIVKMTDKWDTLSESAVEALAVIAIATMVIVSGNPGYEPVAAITSIAIGKRYLTNRR